ncbi:MAG: hypothetical protein ACPL4K_01250 [Candidatus Margulisiibacteriota bacterium]
MKDLAEDIIEEGISVLFSNLGPIKATKFLQVLSIPKGDAVKEIEEKTEGISKEKALELISRAKAQNPQLWERVGLI